MADVIWDGDVAGPLYDDLGAHVAYSDGNGIITKRIPGGTWEANRLVVQNCDTMKMFIGDLLTATVNVGGTAKGDILIQGTAARPILITSDQGSPAPGDWIGLVAVTGIPYNLQNGPTIEVYHATIEYASEALLCSSTDGNHASFILHDSTIQKCSSHLINWRVGGRARPEIRRCVLIGCNTDGDIARSAVRIRGNPSTSAPNYQLLTIDYTTILWRTLNSSGLQVTLLVVDRATMQVKNSIVTQENTDGAQVSNVAGTGPPDGAFTSLGYCFIHTYVEAQALGSWALHATDQEVDPGFVSAACATPDLRPDGGAGSPDLWHADSLGAFHPGAVEPSNLSSFTTVDAAGVQSLWGERKQRIYERSLSTRESVGVRGRGIRVRVRSRDERSIKHLAGLWVRHQPEKVK